MFYELPCKGGYGCSFPEEKRMNKAELTVFRDKLLALRARLRGDVNQMADAALKKSRSEANGDLSSMMESEGGTLVQIEAALERIEDGDYGLCEECGTRIPKMRLNALPYAAMCVKCASHLEESL